MSLYQKHRPKTLEEIVGNASTVAALSSLLSRPKDKQPRAFLFEGGSGCGKTTLARITATMLGCHPDDFTEVDSADFRGIDFAREIRQKMTRKPLHGSLRVWLLDECHQMTKDAQSALLKGLEDTPEHVVLMLATTDPEKLLPTIRNRCTRFALSPLEDGDLFRLLRSVSHKEGKEVSKPILKRLAAAAMGSPRAALTALDKVLDLPEDQQEEAIQLLERKETAVIDLCRALIKGEKWSVVSPIIEGLKLVTDPEDVRRAVLGYAASVLLKSGQSQAYVVMDSFKTPTYDLGWSGIVLSCYEANYANSQK